MKKILILLGITVVCSYANSLGNISLAKVLNKYRGSEYSVLLMPQSTITSGRGDRVKEEVQKGYVRSVAELMRQVELRNIKLNLKVFSPDGSNLPQYIEQDKKAYSLLKDLLDKQVAIKDSILKDFKDVKDNLGSKTSADSIGLDEIDDSAYDVSKQKSSFKGVSPNDLFVDAFIQLSEPYNNGKVTNISKAKHPYLSASGTSVMKNVQSIYGMAFFPEKKGSIHFIKIYLVIGIIKTEEKDEVQVVVKETPLFRWDKNALYITGASGKILRQLIAGALGETFLD